MICFHLRAPLIAAVGLSLIPLLTFSTPSSGVTRYVEKWGSATNLPNCRRTTPCGSIQAAIDVSSLNDRVVVGPGLYRESLFGWVTGLRLESIAGRHGTTVVTNFSTDHGVNVSAPRTSIGKRGKGFTFIGANQPDRAGIHVDVHDEIPRIRIEGNRMGTPRSTSSIANAIFDNFHGIFILNGGGKAQIRNNILQNNQGTALTCNDCAKALIQENRIESNGGTGMLIFSGEKPTLQRNFISTNVGAGAYVASLAVGARFRDSVTELNGPDEGLWVAEGAGGTFESNISARNIGQGFEIDQDDTTSSMTVRKNLSYQNVQGGFRLSDAEGAKVEKNLALQNFGHGFSFLSTVALGALKNNAAISNQGCGTLSDGSTHPNTRFYRRGNLESPPCIALFPDISPTSRPYPVNVRRAAGIVGG